MKHHRGAKALAWALALCMVVGLLPAVALAAEDADAVNTSGFDSTKNTFSCVEHSDHGSYAALSTESVLPLSGMYYLTGDLTVASNLEVSGNTTICLNGHTVTFTAPGQLSTLGGAVLTLKNGKVTGTAGDFVSVAAQSQVLAENVEFSLASGSTVDEMIVNDGAITMENCKFTGGTMNYGVIWTGQAAELTLENAEICDAHFSNDFFLYGNPDSNVMIENCFFHDLKVTKIGSYTRFLRLHTCKNVVVKNSTFYKLSMTEEAQSNNVIFASGVGTLTIDNVHMYELPRSISGLYALKIQSTAVVSGCDLAAGLLFDSCAPESGIEISDTTISDAAAPCIDISLSTIGKIESCTLSSSTNAIHVGTGSVVKKITGGSISGGGHASKSGAIVNEGTIESIDGNARLTGSVALRCASGAEVCIDDATLIGEPPTNTSPEGYAIVNVDGKAKITISGGYFNKQIPHNTIVPGKVLLSSTEANKEEYPYTIGEAPTHSITYDLDGGDSNEKNPTCYVQGIGVPSFTAPLKDGYSFVGWKLNGGADTVTSIPTTQTGDVTLTAVWEEDNTKYTVTLDLEGCIPVGTGTSTQVWPGRPYEVTLKADSKILWWGIHNVSYPEGMFGRDLPFNDELLHTVISIPAVTQNVTVKYHMSPCKHPYISSFWKYDAINHWHICKGCESIVNIAAHTYPADWIVERASTLTTPGLRSLTCSVCGHKIYDSIPVTGTTDKMPDGYSGDIIKAVEVAPGAPVTTMNSSKAELVNSNILTGEEKTQIQASSEKPVNARIWLEVASVDPAELTTDQTEKVENAAARVMGEGSELTYFDVSLFKKVGDGDVIPISKPGIPISVTITIPEELLNHDQVMVRNYAIVRLHNGVAELLPGTFNSTTNEFTFQTDKFSTYAIAYKDVSKSTGGDSDYAPVYPPMIEDTEGGAVTVSPKRPERGDKVTITPDPDKGYEVADITVLDKNGDPVAVTDNGDGTYSFKQPSGKVTVTANFRRSSGVANWLNTTDHIAYMHGYDTGRFGPNDDMTRAQAAQMFYNLLLNKDVPTTADFADIPDGAWYEQAANTLAALDIMSGIGNNQFAPDRAITRAEFTVVAMRFARLDVGGENIFSDVSESDWFYEQVKGAVKYGWIGGHTDGTFRPQSTISRAEVAAIVNRMLGRSADEGFVDANQDKLRLFPDVSKSHWAYYNIVEAANAHGHTKETGEETWTSLKSNLALRNSGS